MWQEGHFPLGFLLANYTDKSFPFSSEDLQLRRNESTATPPSGLNLKGRRYSPHYPTPSTGAPRLLENWTQRSYLSHQAKCQMDRNSVKNETTAQVLEESMGGCVYALGVGKSFYDSNPGPRVPVRPAEAEVLGSFLSPVAAALPTPASDCGRQGPLGQGRDGELLSEEEMENQPDWLSAAPPTPPWRREKEVSLSCLTKRRPSPRPASSQRSAF